MLRYITFNIRARLGHGFKYSGHYSFINYIIHNYFRYLKE